MKTMNEETRVSHDEPGSAGTPAGAGGEGSTGSPGPGPGTAPPPQPGYGYASYGPQVPMPRSVAQAAHLLNDPRVKSPILAGVLSSMPGLGQVYVGYYPRGFVHAIVVASLIMLLNTNHLGEFHPLAVFFLVFFWLYNIIDAMRRATLYNQVIAGGEAPDLPEDFKMPTLAGSIFGGVAFMAGGFILLLNTRFGMPLDWVRDWWPVLPMAFGAYLFGKAIRDRT
jgi:hypothetical protein